MRDETVVEGAKFIVWVPRGHDDQNGGQQLFIPIYVDDEDAALDAIVSAGSADDIVVTGPALPWGLQVGRQ